MNTEAPSGSLKVVRIIRNENGMYGGYLVIRYLDESSKPTSYGCKITIPDSFRTSAEAIRESDKLFSRYIKDEISIQQYSEKIKLRGYRIIGKARFDADREGWEPVLELKKIEEPNRGQTQIIIGRNTAFARNLFATEERAAKFAIDAGKMMVIDRTGLDI